MSSPDRMVIVGAGQAGVQTAEALRALAYEGEIVLLGDEPHTRPTIDRRCPRLGWPER